MKKSYYIDYLQEHVEGQAHTYRCAHCKIITTKINGRLEGHLPSCSYRINLERGGYEGNANSYSNQGAPCDEMD